MSNERLLTKEEISNVVGRYTVEDAKFPDRYMIICEAQDKKTIEELKKSKCILKSEGRKVTIQAEGCGKIHLCVPCYLIFIPEDTDGK